jgi:hypothetical protein
MASRNTQRTPPRQFRHFENIMTNIACAENMVTGIPPLQLRTASPTCAAELALFKIGGTPEFAIHDRGPATAATGASTTNTQIAGQSSAP